MLGGIWVGRHRKKIGEGFTDMLVKSSIGGVAGLLPALEMKGALQSFFWAKEG